MSNKSFNQRNKQQSKPTEEKESTETTETTSTETLDKGSVSETVEGNDTSATTEDNGDVEESDGAAIEAHEQTKVFAPIEESPFESPLNRNEADTEVFKQASETLEFLAKELDVPFLPNFQDREISNKYKSIYKEIVRCLNVEKTSDLTALCNFISKLIVEYDRTFSPRRIYSPLQVLNLSPKEFRFYEEIFNVFIMLNTDGTIARNVLEEKLHGLMDGDKIERFVKWVSVKQNG